MKKIFATTSFAVLLTVVSGIAQAQTQTEGNVIPEGTTARLALLTPISSKLNDEGDRVRAALDEEIIGEDGRVLIPVGTEFTGRITQIRPAGQLQKEARITIVFESMRLAHGIEKISTIVTAVNDYANDRKLKAKDDEGKIEGGRSAKQTGRNMTGGGMVGGALGVVVAISGGGQKSIPIGLDAGIILGAIVTKGNEIRLGPETIIRIRFERPVILPAS